MIAADTSSPVEPKSTFVHATAVVFGEAGILLRGRSGAGKSSLALSLMALAGQLGRFGALVGDDRVGVTQVGGRLVAAAHPATRGAIEQRGEGILSCEHEAAVVVRCVIDLVDAGPAGLPRLPEEGDRTAEIDGVCLPRLALAVGTAASDQARQVASLVDRVTRRKLG